MNDAAANAAFPGAALALRRLVKRYASIVAINDVSLDVEAGEFVTFLGPSGSGKTTTLNVIAGLTLATSGDVLMDNRPIGNLPPHKRNLGMVFQHYALFPHMTAAENIAFALKRRRVAKADQRTRVAHALELVRLTGFGDRYPRELSGGEQQRVALARAFVFNPRVLLMDEPLGALDKKLREWLQLEIKRIHRELGITFVYVTHDQEEALALSDRIAVFSKGRIEQIGAPNDLYEQPRTQFVAEFIGESNIFPGTVIRGARETCIQGPGYELRTSSSPSPDVGARGVLVVRPERVQLARAGEAPSGGVNVLRGAIRDVTYLGAFRRVAVEFATGRRVLVRDESAAASPLGVGDCVEVYWSPADSILLPPSPPEVTEASVIEGARD